MQGGITAASILELINKDTEIIHTAIDSMCMKWTTPRSINNNNNNMDMLLKKFKLAGLNSDLFTYVRD